MNTFDCCQLLEVKVLIFVYFFLSNHKVMLKFQCINVSNPCTVKYYSTIHNIA